MKFNNLRKKIILSIVVTIFIISAVTESSNFVMHQQSPEDTYTVSKTPAILSTTIEETNKALGNQETNENQVSESVQNLVHINPVVEKPVELVAEAPLASEPAQATEVSVDVKLQGLLDVQLQGLSSKWDVRVENLKTGEIAISSTNLDECTSMVSASIIKIFIMGTVYDQVEQGRLNEEDVYQDVYSMITISDNVSANRLTKLLGGGDADAGMRLVNNFSSAIGCENVAYNRLMLVNNGLQNYVTAADCALILKKIYDGECVNAEFSKTMLDILKAQTVNNRIPAGLPTEIISAHKTGDLSGICCADVGIVFTEKADYIICVICNDPYTDSGAANKIVGISKTVYDYIITKNR